MDDKEQRPQGREYVEAFGSMTVQSSTQVHYSSSPYLRNKLIRYICGFINGFARNRSIAKSIKERIFALALRPSR